ncbi:uncharacterized protein LOC117107294, partial [Anneissia japonica]|uniref:uncharacterized protein LOC117107294 n=1 Tax=Anneissia japonica TaxID=1529436 RepID=UPI001425BB1E
MPMKIFKEGLHIKIWTLVTYSVVKVVDNLFSVEEEILMESQMKNQAPTEIVKFLEQQLSQVELDDDGVYNASTPNLAVQVQKVDTSRISEENITYFSFVSKSSETSVGPVEEIHDSEKIPDAANVSIAVPRNISTVIEKNNLR